MAGTPTLKQRIRGIRNSIPQGYILGRVSGGVGDVELISFNNLGNALIASGSPVGGGGRGGGNGQSFLVNGDNPVGLILAPDGQTIGVPQ